MADKLAGLRAELKRAADVKKAKVLQRFFRTGKGEYGEGDIFYGITVPKTRAIAKKYSSLRPGEVKELLRSKMHEGRLCALLILVHKFNAGNDKEKKRIFDFYIKNSSRANNWDLVDLSADKIAGKYLLGKKSGRKILYRFARSKNLWQRRIAIISTFAFIKIGQYDDTLRIAKMLLTDSHELIYKAAGWMLREVGKRNPEAEEKFLKKHHAKMPRTMLRYAIEKLPQEKKEFYMKRR